jgi:hypothetical protein
MTRGLPHFLTLLGGNSSHFINEVPDPVVKSLEKGSHGIVVSNSAEFQGVT